MNKKNFIVIIFGLIISIYLYSPKILANTYKICPSIDYNGDAFILNSDQKRYKDKYSFPYINIALNDKYFVNFEDFQKFRISVNGGFSYQTAEIGLYQNYFMHDYLKGLKNGYHFSADFAYFITKPLGIGFKSYLFKTSNKLDDVLFSMADGTEALGTLSDNLSISFIGPAFI